MRNEEQAYRYIKEIADKQIAKQEKISRADVAFILKDKYKVDCTDGAILSGLVYRAYKNLGEPESIRKAIVINNESMSVVDQYELNAQLDEGNTEQAIAIVNDDLNNVQDILIEAKQNVSDVLKIELAKEITDLNKLLEGTNDIQTLQSKSAALMQNYGKMVESYHSAEMGVKTDIHNFIELRSCVNSLFMQYANALVDIFGDSIKVVAPQLFDFDAIRWLDVSAMQKQVQLEFDKLDERCTLLMGEIASHYQQTVNQLPVWMKMSKSIGSKGGIYGSLVMGAISYLNHWLDAQEKTTTIKKEYVQFENSIKKDRQQINSDVLRLATIHKVLNDLYIPRADAFVRLSDQVLSDDLQKLLNAVYTDDVKALKEERDLLLKRCKELERSINDHNENIALYDAQLSEWQGMLDAQKKNYEEAKSRKPAEPNILSRFLTFGVAQRNYGRQLLEWDQHDGELVAAYEDTLMDVYESKEDKTNHTNHLNEEKQEYEACKEKLKEINRQMAEKMQCTPQQKLEVLKHLKNLLSLLHTGKVIIETKLDDNLTNVTTLSKQEEITTLPNDIINKLHDFAGNICAELKENGTEISNSVLKEFGLSQNDITIEMTEGMQHAVDKASEILKNWSYLQTEQMKTQLSEAIYNQEMARLKKEFQSTMSNIDQKNKILLQVLKRANTATNNDDLRNALIDLAGIPEQELSESDFEAILKGEKTLEI